MNNTGNRWPVIPFSLRFVAVHVVTYAAFGIFFMLFSQYFDYFSSDPLLSQVMKDADALTVRLAQAFPPPPKSTGAGRSTTRTAPAMPGKRA